MNEDDTFNALRRIPFSELEKLAKIKKYGSEASWHEFFESHNWTWQEYLSIRKSHGEIVYPLDTHHNRR